MQNNFAHLKNLFSLICWISDSGSGFQFPVPDSGFEFWVLGLPLNFNFY